MSETNVEFTQPPHTRPYFHLATEKWDMEFQRNCLLHFIHSKGLDAEFLKWVYANAPEDWFSEELEDE